MAPSPTPELSLSGAHLVRTHYFVSPYLAAEQLPSWSRRRGPSAPPSDYRWQDWLIKKLRNWWLWEGSIDNSAQRKFQLTNRHRTLKAVYAEKLAASS